MSTRKAYLTDLTDAQWERLRPFLPEERPLGVVGRPRKYGFRQIVNALLYLLKTGCQWRLLPHDFPPYTLVLHYFRLWRDDGTLEAIHHALRLAVRQKVGKEAEPSAVVLDSQSVKTTEKGGPKTLVMMRVNRSKDANAISPSIRSV